MRVVGKFVNRCLMKLCVVSPYPPDLNGIGEYAWNVVHGLAATDRFNSITVLTQQPDDRAPSPALSQHAQAKRHPAVRTRPLWMRDEPLGAARLARAIFAEQADATWLNLDF